VVGGGYEQVALLGLLADEEDVERVLIAEAGEARVLVPGGEVGVVASELVEVLVDASGAVVLEQERRRRMSVGAFDYAASRPSRPRRRSFKQRSRAEASSPTSCSLHGKLTAASSLARPAQGAAHKSRPVVPYSHPRVRRRQQLSAHRGGGASGLLANTRGIEPDRPAILPSSGPRHGDRVR
jgi:hypothetical protein